MGFKRRNPGTETAWKELAGRHGRGTQRGWREGVNRDGGGSGWADGDCEGRRIVRWEGNLLVKKLWKVKIRSLALAKRWGKEEYTEPQGAECRWWCGMWHPRQIWVDMEGSESSYWGQSALSTPGDQGLAPELQWVHREKGWCLEVQGAGFIYALSGESLIALLSIAAITQAQS